MLRFGPKLERRQMVLFRAVDIGAELFAMSAACVRARMLCTKGNTEAMALADLFCREARLRVAGHFRSFYGRNDKAMYAVSQQVLRGHHVWLEEGIVDAAPPMGERDPAARTRDPHEMDEERTAAAIGD